MIVEFDLDHEFRKKHDAELFYDWLSRTVKHKATVWQTEGDDTLEDGTIVPWLESEWTWLRAEYDPSDPEINPDGHHFRWPGWQCSDYHIIRVRFSDRKEAIHFALEYKLEPTEVTQATF